MILIIDNYDSFTYNLVQQIERLSYATDTYYNDKISITKIKKLAPSKIIISPGPGRPKDCGICKKVVNKFYKTIPILGVCIGHQCIGEVFGAKVKPAKKIIHGNTSKIYHNKKGIFSQVPSPFKAARYHSLVLDKLPENFIQSARSDDGSIMAMQHTVYPLYGIQFHTESFMTKRGDTIIKNFLNL